MLDGAVRTAVDPDRIVERRETAIETSIMQLAPFGGLKMVDEVLLALIAYDVDERFSELRVSFQSGKAG